MRHLVLRVWGGAAAALALTGSAAEASETATYVYDALGRLIRVENAGGANNGVVSAFRLDPAGNRTSVSVTGVTAAASPAITNRSFENPQVGSYAYRPAAPGVTFSSNSGIAANGSAWGFPAAHDGVQVAFIQHGVDGQTGWFDQTVTGLTPGRSYRVTYAAAQRPGYPGNNVRVSVDGVLVSDVVPVSSGYFGAVGTRSFVASGATANVRFAATPTSGDAASGIDMVGIEEAAAPPPAPVVVNGSYEDPIMGGGFVYAPKVDNVTFNALAGVAANGSVWSFPATSDGVQVGFLQSATGNDYGQIDHLITGLTVGKNYSIRFKAVRRPGYPASAVSVSVVNGASLLTVTPADGWTEYTTRAFPANAASVLIRLQNSVTGSDSAVGVDNIQAVEN